VMFRDNIPEGHLLMVGASAGHDPRTADRPASVP
jgi:hypothetical protein